MPNDTTPRLSWTMMHHFSKNATREMKTKKDVIWEAKEIVNYVDFIRQENIDADVEKILNLPRQKGERINISPRPCRQVFNQRIKSVVKELDGEVAYVLGGYS